MNPTTRHERLELFAKFCAENPHVYSELVARARRAKEKGARLGMRCLWENLRYEFSVAIRHEKEAPRLNDWLAPFFARLISPQEPDLADYFDLRGHDLSSPASSADTHNQDGAR